MISVIVPIYNSEKYLKKCIESIVNQTYKDLEIILVDDGSADNSGNICDEYANKDKRIKVVHQENKGQATARNEGLMIAEGEYIAFVDSDDYIAPDMYELLYRMIKDHDCDIAMCGHKEIYEDKESSSRQECDDIYLDKNAMWQEVFGCLNNAVWNKLYRKSLMGDVNFPTRMMHGEDLIFNLNYLKNCENGVLNKSEKYYYIQRKGSVTNSKFSEKKLTEISTKDLALEMVKDYCPTQIDNARKFCFRARMNLIRSIVKADKENEYTAKLQEFKKYVDENYKIIKTALLKKEKAEYQLFNKFPQVYKLLIKMIF